jgi:acyl-homoserine-lactone acylase
MNRVMTILRKPVLWMSLCSLAIGIGLFAASHAYTQPTKLQLPAGTVIQRDAWGVPTIRGVKDADVAHGLAYAHSQDDFKTIQLQLLSARGELGAVQGFKGLKQDFLTHWMDVRSQVAMAEQQLSPATKDLIAGYVNGLNQYASEHPQEVLRSSLFPIQSADVVAGFVMVSPLFFGLDKVVGAIYDNAPLPNDAPVQERGSNAFVFGPGRTVDGSTVLVANSHQPWEGPVAWYEVRVQSQQGWKFSGALFPGSPTPLHGHNDHLGWANTINRPDLVDVYQLRMDSSGDQYLLDGQWKKLDQRRVWLKLKVGPFVIPVPQTMHRSEHGPVLKNKSGYFAVRYAGMGEVKQIEQYYQLTKATTFEQWTQVMRMRAVPATNFIYGDTKGNIALLYNARFPVRDSKVNWSNVLPGDRSDLIWTKDASFESQPFLINPKSGYIVNANNTPFKATFSADDLKPEAYRETIGIESDRNNRIDRAIKLIDTYAKISRAQIEAVKYDKGYEKDSVIGKQMLSVLAAKPTDENSQRALDLLKTWDWNLDGVGAADSLAALVLRPFNRANYRRMPPPAALTALEDAAAFLLKQHQRLDIPLGDLLRLRRGHLDLPLSGGPDVLRAIGWEASPDGRLVADFGDSFLMFVTWAKDAAPKAQSVSPYGAAVNRADSKHYNDQANLFVQEKLKPIDF